MAQLTELIHLARNFLQIKKGLAIEKFLLTVPRQ